MHAWGSGGRDADTIAPIRQPTRPRDGIPDQWLDQREAAAIFGGGVNAFSRYENGKVSPPIALIKLLKLLDKHPELLDEIRAV